MSSDLFPTPASVSQLNMSAMEDAHPTSDPNLQSLPPITSETTKELTAEAETIPINDVRRTSILPEEDLGDSPRSGISRLVENCLKALEEHASEVEVCSCDCNDCGRMHYNHNDAHVHCNHPEKNCSEPFHRHPLGDLGRDTEHEGRDPHHRLHHYYSEQELFHAAPHHRKQTKTCHQQHTKLIESKFATMALAFKTDRFSLTKRVDVHKHQRDLAESSVNTELDMLRNAFNELRTKCKDIGGLEFLDKVQNQMAVVKRATEKAITRAEMYGQVQQENKVFKALEIMISYVENLKRTYESEHAELEDTKRILMENNIVLDHDQVGVIVDSASGSQGQNLVQGSSESSRNSAGLSPIPAQTETSHRSISRDDSRLLQQQQQRQLNNSNSASSSCKASQSASGKSPVPCPALQPFFLPKKPGKTNRSLSEDHGKPEVVQQNHGQDLATTMEEDETKEEEAVRNQQEKNAAKKNPVDVTEVKEHGAKGTAREDGGLQKSQEMRRQSSITGELNVGVSPSARKSGGAGLGLSRKISTATCRPISYEEDKAKGLDDMLVKKRKKNSLQIPSSEALMTPRRRSASVGEGLWSNLERGDDVTGAGIYGRDGAKSGGVSDTDCDRQRSKVHPDNYAHRYSDHICPEVMLSGTFGKIQRRNLAAALLSSMAPLETALSSSSMPGAGKVGAKFFSRSNSCPQPRLIVTRRKRCQNRRLRSMQEMNENGANGRDSSSDGEETIEEIDLHFADEECLCCRVLLGNLDWLHHEKLHKFFWTLRRLLRRHFNVDVLEILDQCGQSMVKFRRMFAGLLLAMAFIALALPFLFEAMEPRFDEEAWMEAR